MEDSDLQQAAQILRESQHLAVFTGAGMSQESGVPTFRDTLTGLWARYDPTKLATPGAFEADPGLVYRFYEHRRAKLADSQPNAAHVALARYQNARGGVTIVTQNVDGLHQLAGSHPVICLHGDVRFDRCYAGCTGLVSPPPYEENRPLLPVCPVCRQAYLRPAVVWFGEILDPVEWDAAEDTVQTASALLMIGTSAVVHPAAALPELVLEQGKPLIDVNPAPTPYSRRATIYFPSTAGNIIPQLVSLALTS
jgi:NAD-dependent deacetylase